MVWPVKGDPWSSEREEVDRVVLEGNNSGLGKCGSFERRALRTQYFFIRHLISNERDDASLQDSKMFKSIFTHVEALHENVKKPREQVADAETLLRIASTLGISVRSQKNEGLTPSDFITAILKNFSHQPLTSRADNSQNLVFWANIGIPVSHFLESVPGCCSIIGPMSNEVKQEKRVYRKRAKPTESTRPEEIDCGEQGAKIDTDSNMLTMFDILKKRMRVGLESLLLNRLSFAQTVENIFALSFLVKDGRAEITVDDNGRHLVSPRNGPSASAVASGAVLYHYFVFRFDFKDWKVCGFQGS